MSDFKLSQGSYQKLLDAERGLTSVLAEYDNAEKCGVDCTAYREKLRMQLAVIANMKAYYAPKVS